MTIGPALTRDVFWKTRANIRRGDAELARRASAFPYFVPIGSALDREVVVEGRPVLMLGSNNYLGLANHPEVLRAATEAVDRFGAGCTGSRLMNGTLDLHLELEAELADWLGRSASLVFTTGYLANVGAIATLCHSADVVVTDAKNHASILDGAQMAAARTVSIRHNDLAQLAAKLGIIQAQDRGALVVWDAVFSMEGDSAPVADIVDVAHRAGARTMIDEAHSLGVLGPSGAGLCEEHETTPDLVMGTFSKSLASCGGFVAGDADVIEYLRIHARQFLFTAAGVPAAIAAALTATRIARAEPERGRRARGLAERLFDGLVAGGFAAGWGDAAIVSVAARDEWKALLAWRRLMERDIYVNVGMLPAVPKGEALLRLSTTCAHCEADVDRCLDAFDDLRALLQ